MKTDSLWLKINSVCVIIVSCIQWKQERVNISQEIHTIICTEDWENIWIGIGFWDYIQVMIILGLLIMRYPRVTPNVKNVQGNFGMIYIYI